MLPKGHRTVIARRANTSDADMPQTPKTAMTGRYDFRCKSLLRIRLPQKLGFTEEQMQHVVGKLKRFQRSLRSHHPEQQPDYPIIRVAKRRPASRRARQTRDGMHPIASLSTSTTDGCYG